VSRRAGRRLPAAWVSEAGIGEAVSARSVLSVSKPRGLWRRATASPWLPRFPPIEAPSQKTLLWYEVFDNRRWLFGGAGIVFVLGYYLAPWSAVGRDPKGGAIIPLFQPRAGISPALAKLHP
jgi:hypothetical protein